MSFGKKILELRRQKRLTQRELAALLEVDFTYISKIENDGIPHPPSEQLIRNMARVLSANAEELLDLAGKFDQRALQEVVAEIPEAGVLLRRLQSGRLTREQIQGMLDQTSDQSVRD